MQCKTVTQSPQSMPRPVPKQWTGTANSRTISNTAAVECCYSWDVLEVVLTNCDAKQHYRYREGARENFQKRQLPTGLMDQGGKSDADANQESPYGVHARRGPIRSCTVSRSAPLAVCASLETGRPSDWPPCSAPDMGA